MRLAIYSSSASHFLSYVVNGEDPMPRRCRVLPWFVVGRASADRRVYTSLLWLLSASQMSWLYEGLSSFLSPQHQGESLFLQNQAFTISPSSTEKPLEIPLLFAMTKNTPFPFPRCVFENPVIYLHTRHAQRSPWGDTGHKGDTQSCCRDFSAQEVRNAIPKLFPTRILLTCALNSSQTPVSSHLDLTAGWIPDTTYVLGHV